jgi:hypothetical protein
MPSPFPCLISYVKAYRAAASFGMSHSDPQRKVVGRLSWPFASISLFYD